MTNAKSLLLMADIVRRQSLERPDHAALVFAGNKLSYRDLDERSNRIANGLKISVIEPATRIAFLDFNSNKFFEVFFATAKIDCVFVAVNARLAAPEVLYVLQDCRASVLFVGREHYALIEAIETLLEDLQKVIALDGGHPRWVNYDRWRDTCPAGDPSVKLNPSSDVIQLYTSGTTGRPKGVCHTNRTWHCFSEAGRAADWGKYDANTVSFVCMPVFHVAGFNLTCLTLLNGGTAVLSRKMDVPEILDVIPKFGITNTLFVPAMILAILAHPQAAVTDFSSLRHISYGAAPMAEELLGRAQELFSCGFVHLYGLTEILGGATYLPASMHRPEFGKLRSCGRAYPGLELRVVDTSGVQVPSGEVGEIIIRCAWIMREYWNDAAATREAVRDGWLHSGDAGYLDTDGYLYLHDRVKDMIVTGGENVYPAEVENALFGHPSIADVAVIGVPDDTWGEAIKAIIVLKPGAVLQFPDIVNYARQRIAGYKLPKSVDVVEALPRNTSGKVLRRELRAAYWRGYQRRIN